MLSGCALSCPLHAPPPPPPPPISLRPHPVPLTCEKLVRPQWLRMVAGRSTAGTQQEPPSCTDSCTEGCIRGEGVGRSARGGTQLPAAPALRRQRLPLPPALTPSPLHCRCQCWLSRCVHHRRRPCCCCRRSPAGGLARRACPSRGGATGSSGRPQSSCTAQHEEGRRDA